MNTTQQQSPESDVPFPLQPPVSPTTDVTHARIPTAAEIIAGSSEFQLTLFRVLESVRVMKTHLEKFRSSALAETAELFEADLISLATQITEVVDQCVDYESNDGDYETSYTNLRFTLRQFMEMVRERHLNTAAVFLSFAVDAMYSFMEAATREVSSWMQRQSIETLEALSIRTGYRSTSVTSSNISEQIPFITTPTNAPPLPPIQQKPSLMSRIRAVSTRRSKPTLPPSSIKTLEETVRKSMDERPRPALPLLKIADVGTVNVVDIFEKKSLADEGVASFQDRLQRALKRCRSTVKPDEKKARNIRCGLQESRSIYSPNRFLKFMRRELLTPTPSPQLI